MIAYVKGILEDISPDNGVIDVGGVGINVRIAGSTASLLTLGSEVKLFTFTYVREDTFNLYGFLSKDDLELFKMLLSVSGVGPKGALAVLSVLSARDLRFAIASADSKTIAKAQGIGKRTAERIVLDLKDKVTVEVSDDIALSDTSGSAVNTDSTVKSEAVEALVALGYSGSEAMKAVNKVPDEDVFDVGAVLKLALKFLH